MSRRDTKTGLSLIFLGAAGSVLMLYLAQKPETPKTAPPPAPPITRTAAP
jgi:hypothetical protein